MPRSKILGMPLDLLVALCLAAMLAVSAAMIAALMRI